MIRLGISSKAKILVVFLIISIQASGQTGKSLKYRFNNNLRKNEVTAGKQALTINYSLSELDIESITNDHGSFFRLSIPGHSHSSEPGKPEMPVLSRLITIPEGSRYRITVTDVTSTPINPPADNIKGVLFPSQEGETKQVQSGKKQFAFDRKSYLTAGFIRSDTVKIEYLGKIRGKRVSNLVISPVRYNPLNNTLDVITSMKIEIDFIQSATSPTKSISSESFLFDQSLEEGLLNYYPEDVITGYSDQPVEMIILTDTSFTRFLEPFFKWKRQKGFRLDVIYKGKGLAGDDYNEIKKTISGIYEASSLTGHPPEYLLIIGDSKKVPTFGTGYLTDMYYGEFDGNGDYFPDMFIGRVPAPDTTSVKSFVQKIIQYERFEFADTNKFYSRSLAFAGKDANYANYMNGQVRYATSNYLNTANRINEFHFYYPEGSTKKDSVMNLISNGLSFVNYSGHGSSSGWLHIEIKSPDISNLRNNNMYPLVISNACRTAQFDDTASFGNKMLLTPHKGAIGFIGCSNDSYWDEDFYWAVGTGVPNSDPKYIETGLGAFDRLFHTHNELPSDWFISMGQVNYAGNLSVSSSPSQKKKYYWETYNLLGDPSALPFIGTPDHFNLSLPDILPRGIRSLPVTIDPFAYIAISDFNNLWDASYASPSGAAVLELPVTTADSCLIVVTGQNKIPLMKTVHFNDIVNEYVNLAGTAVNDITGNNNNAADFGETFFLKLRVSNLGLTDAKNLSARISSTSPWVTINSDYVLIGTLPAKSEQTIDNVLSITIDNNVPDLGIITIDLTLKDDQTEKKYKVDIAVHAPELDIINCTIDDSATGNNNFIADPGETFNLVFHIRNLGSSNTSGQLIVESQESDLDVLDGNVKSGVLQFGRITTIPIMVKLSESAQNGDFISLLSILDCTPFVVNKDFIFRVGRVRESFESASFHVFPWINASSKPWTITGSTSADGNMAARSGAINHNGNSALMMRAFYPVADSLKFYYRVSSEPNYDYFQFKLNDVEILKASGETSWTKKSIAVPAGYNKLEWIYKKDNSVSQGADCAMIDLIDFSQSVPVDYIERDLEVARIVSPKQKEMYGQEPVIIKVLNTGADTLRGFNLAYSVNNRFPVTQYFENELVPYGDTATVTFDRRADLDLNGKYDIMVYGYENSDDYVHNDTLKVSVENTEIDESVNVFPNPFTNELNISISSKKNMKIRLILTDLAGKQRVNVEKDITEGGNYVILNTQQLSPAHYILVIRGANFSKAFPVIKIRQ